MMNVRDKPYAVLVGDVGSGKSTVVEKVTGTRGRSSDSDTSVTRTTEYFSTPDGSLLISDTPGANSMSDKLQHNAEIAGALNFSPPSKMLITVKAEPRLDNVVGGVRKYGERFLELPETVIGVLVTHMDQVPWSKARFEQVLEQELGMSGVVCTG